MKSILSNPSFFVIVVSSGLLTSSAGAQQQLPPSSVLATQKVQLPGASEPPPATPPQLSGIRYVDAAPRNTRLAGTHDFDGFMGFFSNPIQNVDPRAITAMWPIFSSGWASGNGPLQVQSELQIYGAGMYVALSDRLSIGMNQGGYAVLHASSDRQRALSNLGLPVPDRSRGGTRQGWLNLGGFVQYTLIADPEEQFLLTAGLRWEAPSGATQVFQGGANPVYLAPYLTVGKGYGNWHVLATGGYEFPAGSAESTTELFYLNLHIDRQFNRLYPFLELNGSYHTRTTDVNLPLHRGVLDIGSFTSTGNMLVLAVGINAAVIPGKMEFGVGYGRPIASQDRFEYNGLQVKMLYRY